VPFDVSVKHTENPIKQFLSIYKKIGWATFWSIFCGHGAIFHKKHPVTPMSNLAC
jgi:hypothetical protein